MDGSSESTVTYAINEAFDPTNISSMFETNHTSRHWDPREFGTRLPGYILYGKKTNILVPDVLEAYEEDGSFVLVTRLVPGVQMSKLSSEEQAVVTKEVDFPSPNIADASIQSYRRPFWNCLPSTKSDSIFSEGHGLVDKHHVRDRPGVLSL